MAEELWSDESLPVPRPVFGAVICDRCTCRVELGALDGAGLYEAARRRGFVIGAEQLCRACARRATVQGDLFAHG